MTGRQTETETADGETDRRKESRRRIKRERRRAAKWKGVEGDENREHKRKAMEEVKSGRKEGVADRGRGMRK